MTATTRRHSVVVDIAGLVALNNRFGHELVDGVIAAAGRMLQTVPDAVTTRIGGGAWLLNVGDDGGPEAALDRLAAAVQWAPLGGEGPVDHLYFHLWPGGKIPQWVTVARPMLRVELAGFDALTARFGHHVARRVSRAAARRLRAKVPAGAMVTAAGPGTWHVRLADDDLFSVDAMLRGELWWQSLGCGPPIDLAYFHTWEVPVPDREN